MIIQIEIIASLLLVAMLIRLVDGKIFATQMSQRIVTTQYGRLRGLLVTLPSPGLPQVEAYLGIEYASLLGSELRFMPPTSPVGKWDDVRSAIKFKAACPQRLPNLDTLETQIPLEKVERIRRLLPFMERQQEDCLNLNIYVPVSGTNQLTTKHTNT